jgi:hypothetical protein
MKDILFTRTEWINQGRDHSTLADNRYADGDEKFITIKGIPLRDPVLKTRYVIRRVQKFQTL